MRILCLEDSELDAELICEQLLESGYEIQFERVFTEKAFIEKILEKHYDIILSDYNLPGFSGQIALKHAQAHCPKVPFIFVSGAIGEIRAVELLKQGALDYVLKNQMEKLPFAVRRALEEVQELESRRKAEEALKRNEKLLNEAQHIAKMGSYETDLIHNYWEGSDEFYNIFGFTEKRRYTVEEFQSIVHPDDYHEVMTVFAECLATRKPFNHDYRCVHQVTGSTIHVSSRSQILYNDAGQPIKVFGIKQDITERKQVEEELKQARDIAEKANHAKSMFLANMSHELRTPLNPIIGFSELLATDQAIPAEQRSWISIVRQSAKELLALINDVLSLSKIESGKVELNWSDVRISPLIAHALETVRPLIKEKQIELRYQIQEGTPDLIFTDVVKLKQVLLNLLSNAVKFTHVGLIELLLGQEVVNWGKDLDEPTGKALHFCVRDTGVGIDQEKLAEIFDPFVQVDQSFTRKYGGAGLGLSISRKIIEKMGGTIWVESELNKGSAFHVTIPLHEKLPDNLYEFGTKAQSSPKTGTQPLHILVVEDDEANKVLIEHLLKMDGHTFNFAVDGPMALEKLEHEQFDLVLMDIQIPKLNGLEVTKMIRKKEQGTDRHMIIVALTSYALTGDKDFFMNQGMDDYLAKPLAQSLLRAVLKRWAGKSGKN
ncbi:MAG: response regulator [SAR324 cluster bacterium]|nr:response regulator [SAR324 cluster bacterium]